MMKKILLMILVGALVLPAFVRAEDSTTLGNRKELKPVPVPRAILEGKLQTLDTKTTLNANKLERVVGQHLALATERLNRALTQLGNLLARADKYIGQLEGRGANMSKARTAQVEAVTALDAAKAALADLPNKIGTETKTLRGAIDNVAKLTKVAGQKIQTLIKTIREVVQGLKPLSPKPVSPAEPIAPAPTTDTVPERVN